MRMLLASWRSLLPRVSPLYPWLRLLPSSSSSLGPLRPPPAHSHSLIRRVDLPDRSLERLVDGDVGRQVGVGGRGVDGKAFEEEGYNGQMGSKLELSYPFRSKYEGTVT